MRKFAFAFAAVAALVASSPVGAATLVNENFESGLGVFTATGQANINAGADYIPCCGVTGSAGALANHFVDFGSGNLPSGMISSPIDLVPGGNYTLTFDYGALGAGTETLTLNFAGVTITLTTFANDNLDTTFTHQTVNFFNVLGGPTSLEFHSSGVDNIDSIIDNVLLEGPARAVPEPATWAMMLLGFLGIGFAVRRQRRALPAFA